MLKRSRDPRTTNSKEPMIDAITDPVGLDNSPDRFRIGTLQYTRATLVMLFVWLLWGDFCLTLMELVVPSVLPLKLQSLNASNVLIGVIISTIPNALNFSVCPIVSFHSDRYRSRMGRRIPFLLWATPPLALFLVLIGWSDRIGGWLHRSSVGNHLHLPEVSLVLALIAFFMVMFQIFNNFVASVYYYLFNDVVPQAFLGRFMSLFRVMGTAAGAVFNFWIYPHALTHTVQIFTIAGAIYFVSFMMMCWKVKEGQYPPPPQNVDGRTGLNASVKTFFVESFSHWFYWEFFLANTFWAMSFCVAAFIVFLNLSIGLHLDQLGKITGWASLVSALLLYPAGLLSDKIHPLRTMLIAQGLIVVVGPTNLIWLMVHPTPSRVLIFVVVYAIICLPLNTLYNAALFPMYMRLLPTERYGQFCSADAMVKSISVMIGGPLAGLFMDVLKSHYHGDPYYYRYAPGWMVLMQLISFIFLYRVYRYWKRHGGDTSYVPPLTSEEEKILELGHR
jgi:maltose/moltooligosaccharide transporter